MHFFLDNVRNGTYKLRMTVECRHSLPIGNAFFQSELFELHVDFLQGFDVFRNKTYRDND